MLSTSSVSMTPSYLFLHLISAFPKPHFIPFDSNFFYSLTFGEEILSIPKASMIPNAKDFQIKNFGSNLFLNFYFYVSSCWQIPVFKVTHSMTKIKLFIFSFVSASFFPLNLLPATFIQYQNHYCTFWYLRNRYFEFGQFSIFHRRIINSCLLISNSIPFSEIQ